MGQRSNPRDKLIFGLLFDTSLRLGELMGHSKIETNSIYVDPNIEQLANALDSVFSRLFRRDEKFVTRDARLGEDCPQGRTLEIAMVEDC